MAINRRNRAGRTLRLDIGAALPAIDPKVVFVVIHGVLSTLANMSAIRGPDRAISSIAALSLPSRADVAIRLRSGGNDRDRREIALREGRHAPPARVAPQSLPNRPGGRRLREGTSFPLQAHAAIHVGTWRLASDSSQRRVGTAVPKGDRYVARKSRSKKRSAADRARIEIRAVFPGSKPGLYPRLSIAFPIAVDRKARIESAWPR